MNLPLKIQRQIEEFAKICKLEKVVLFGSRARGTNRERSDKMKKHFRYGLFFALGAMLALGFVACGDESSSGPSKNEETGIETEESSSSVDEVFSSSVNVEESSSSFESEGLSSSVENGASSSSEKSTESSSGKNTEPAEVSSCSVAEGSSSSTTVEPSSSSVKAEQSSSSEKAEASSSSVKVQESSSSVKVEESSSSAKTEMSSSSEKPVESSSSEKVVESSSSKAQSSSSATSSSSFNSAYDSVNNTLIDLRDGQVYKTVTIGLQVWMAENLNYLPQDTIGTFWADRSVCGGGEYKSLQEGNCSIYGRLYETSFTENANYRKKICPDGWSIPSKKQYQNLIAFLGDNAGNKLKDKDKKLWSQNDNTNESGFSVIPSGYWSPYYGFNYLEKEGDAVAALAMIPSSIQNALRIDENNYEFAGYGQWLFIAVRCIKD